MNKFKLLLFGAFFIAPVVFWAACTKKSGNTISVSKTEIEQIKKDLYRCSMHPAVTSDKPDICPICHMNLEKVENEEPHSNPSPVTGETTSVVKKERKIILYRNPMKPEITSPTPAKDSMGMDYIPVYQDEGETVGSASSSQQGIQGRGSFSLSQERQQMIGVTTAKVSVRPLGYEVRASGRVAFDPDLFTAVEEYRQAFMSRVQMKDDLMQGQANEMISSAKTKLKLMGLSDDQIRTLSTGKTSAMNLLLPKGTVWVYAEVFEYEVAGLKAGLKIEVEAPSIPGKVFMGKLSSINPVVNSPTRTVRVRASVPDPQGLLRPDTFMNVKIKVDLGEKLAVPENAVLFSGEKAFVYVVKDQGRFEPHAIQTGLKSQSYYEVLSGLNEGDTIVTSANFLIDSESKLRGVLESAPQAPPNSSPPPSHVHGSSGGGK
ncbi:efflux RND transporter periplasmic adaptor subunit [Bdellovibrionota bacterium FG-2]